MEKYQNDISLIKVGVVDDHELVTSAIANMLNAMTGIRAILQAYSGKELLGLLKTMNELPDIILMDIDMNDMNGIEATRAVTELYPTIKTVALTSRKDQWAIVQMIGAGACAYLTKKIKAEHMEEAIREIYRKGKYHADLYHLEFGELHQYHQSIKDLTFSDNEKRYLQLLCGGNDYNSIAALMGVTVAGVNYYSSCVSKKLKTKNHAATAFAALRIGIVSLFDDDKTNTK